MFFTPQVSLRWALALGAAGFLLQSEAACAQGGGCKRQQQSSMRSGGMQSQFYTPQGFGGQQNQSALQQYALQQYALQQYQLQQNALQQALFQAQLVPGLQGQNLLMAQPNGAVLNGQDTVELLQLQLDNLRDYIAEQQEEGSLTSSRLRALRQRERTLARQLRAAQRRAGRTSPSSSDAVTLGVRDQ
jgi:hypothetical protein